MYIMLLLACSSQLYSNLFSFFIPYSHPCKILQAFLFLLMVLGVYKDHTCSDRSFLSNCGCHNCFLWKQFLGEALLCSSGSVMLQILCLIYDWPPGQHQAVLSNLFLFFPLRLRDDKCLLLIFILGLCWYVEHIFFSLPPFSKHVQSPFPLFPEVLKKADDI